MKKFLTVFAVLSIALLPALVGAQGFINTNTPVGVPAEPAPVTNASAGTVYSLMNQIITILFYVIMFVAIIMILLAAFNYLTARGDSEKVEKAQAALMYAVIAIVIGVLARSVPFIVSAFVRSNVGP